MAEGPGVQILIRLEGEQLLVTAVGNLPVPHILMGLEIAKGRALAMAGIHDINAPTAGGFAAKARKVDAPARD